VTQQESQPSTEGSGAGAPPVPVGRRWRRTDAAVALLCVAIAGYLTSGLWIGPNHRTLVVNASDQALFEWLLAYAADGLRHGHNPFYTDLLNAPGGVNLAVNTAVTVVGVVLAPVTLLLGPSVSFLVALTFGIAATPFAWYVLLSRMLVRTRAAAIAGGLFCGFAPGLVAHANGHINFASGYLVPVIVWRVLELRRPGHVLRNGLILGALVAVQYSLGGETLFFTALTCGAVLGCLLLAGHREPGECVRAFGMALGTAGLTAFVLLSYPLWMQFAGPGSFHGTGFDQVVHSEDLMSYGTFPRRSVAGLLGLGTDLAPNPTEENSFFGVPGLLVLVLVTVLALRGRQRRLALAVAAPAVVFAVLSLGPQLKIDKERTGIPLPYALLQHAPLFDSALASRLALIVTALAGVLLALGLDALRTDALRTDALPARAKTVIAVLITAGLLPLVPTPLLTMDRSPVPHFISSGRWRDYVRPGETLVPVPPVSDLLPDGQRWQAHLLSHGDGATFRIPAGFFLGPGGPEGRGRIGPPPRPTQDLLSDVALHGRRPPVVDDALRRPVRADIRYWGGNVVVLPDGGYGNRWARHHDDLKRVTTDLLQQEPERVDDVWLWRLP
jgi:hypothetical protein